MIGGAAPGRIDGLSDGGPWPRCSLRRHQLSAATMPGASVPGGGRGDSIRAAADNL